MSKSFNSPTARLLQSSRLFSLPRPLPQPTSEIISSSGIVRASDTATSPYPTYQAIATPTSSHFRGDWGLKRPLPKKATDSSTPHIRVKAQDNQQHITDFESAADHTQTEAKWRQMGIPIVLKKTRHTMTNYAQPPTSAYEDVLDNTDPDVVGLDPTRQRPATDPRGRKIPAVQTASSKRWKYRGPWVAGMQEGEFLIFLEQQISGRKDEFHAFLSRRIVDRRIQEEQRLLREAGQTTTISPARRARLRQEIQQNFERELHVLRDDHESSQLGSQLTNYICEFFDLPAIRPVEFSNPAQTKALSNQLTAALEISENGPPSTHPAAGLSHLRTNAIMENHPLHGPQALRSPILARVIQPRNTVTGNINNALFGIGGIVARDPKSTTFKSPSRASDAKTKYLDADAMTSQLDTSLWGGNKAWVQPETASIDEKGRIVLDVSRADRDAIAVKQDDVQYIHDARRSSGTTNTMPLSPPGTRGNANYGVALPGVGTPLPRSRMAGFSNQELGRGSDQGRMGKEDATSKIRELLNSRSGTSRR